MNEFPSGGGEDRELCLRWLNFLRGAVLRKTDGLDEQATRWRPEGKLISLLGIVNHLTHVEWRWIDGGFTGAEVCRTEAEFAPGPQLPIGLARDAYRERARRTDAIVRTIGLTEPCAQEPGTDLRWVLLHLINETARHAGHADAVRELLDGGTRE